MNLKWRNILLISGCLAAGVFGGLLATPSPKSTNAGAGVASAVSPPPPPKWSARVKVLGVTEQTWNTIDSESHVQDMTVQDSNGYLWKTRLCDQPALPPVGSTVELVVRLESESRSFMTGCHVVESLRVIQ